MEDQRELDSLIQAFREHLMRTRGLVPHSLRVHGRDVRTFLTGVFGQGPVHVRDLTPRDVICFIGSLVGRYRPRTINHMGGSLRAFFRFLRAEGLRDDRLDDAVPGAVQRRCSGLPRYLEESQLKRLLASLDCSSPRALRDRAIILCVARLGLRRGDVVGIQFEDINWHAGELRIRKRKTGHGARLPLPSDVGDAIVEYVSRGRPSSQNRHVFLLHGGGRVGQPATPGVVSDAVAVALRRSGIDAPIHGSNLLRHTLATSLIRRGSSLKEIADLMGHRCLESTRVYAKLDLAHLREVALPWPQEAS